MRHEATKLVDFSPSQNHMDCGFFFHFINSSGCLTRFLKGWQSSDFPQALSLLSEKCVLRNFQPDFYSSPYLFCISLTTVKCSGMTITVNEPNLSSFIKHQSSQIESPKSLLEFGTQLNAGHNIWVATWKSNQECGFLWANPAPSVQVHESSVLKLLWSYTDVMKMEHKFLG